MSVNIKNNCNWGRYVHKPLCKYLKASTRNHCARGGARSPDALKATQKTINVHIFQMNTSALGLWQTQKGSSIARGAGDASVGNVLNVRGGFVCGRRALATGGVEHGDGEAHHCVVHRDVFKGHVVHLA